VKITDELVDRVSRNPKVAEGTAPPRLQVALVVCMDARIDPMELFELQKGDAHVIRNAGGLVSDDVIRSVAVSQHALGTRSVMVIQHADCGMQKATEQELTAKLTEFAGMPPTWRVGAFDDLHASVRTSLRRLRESPFLIATDDIRGFVFDEQTGGLTEVS